jgi:hypothetical protein
LARCSPDWLGIASVSDAYAVEYDEVGSLTRKVSLWRPSQGAQERLYSLGVTCNAKTLRRWLNAANEADGLAPTPRRSSSPAVAIALRRYQAQSQEHRERYQHFDASSLARRSAPAEFWQSAAELLSLRVELERAMATASGRTPNTKRLELNAAACRAEAGITGRNRV